MFCLHQEFSIISRAARSVSFSRLSAFAYLIRRIIARNLFETCTNSPQKMIFHGFCHCGSRQFPPLVRLVFPGDICIFNPKNTYSRSLFFVLLLFLLLFSFFFFFFFFSFLLIFFSSLFLFFPLKIFSIVNIFCVVSYFLHAIAFHCIQRLFGLLCITLQGFLVFLHISY